MGSSCCCACCLPEVRSECSAASILSWMRALGLTFRTLPSSERALPTSKRAAVQFASWISFRAFSMRATTSVPVFETTVTCSSVSLSIATSSSFSAAPAVNESASSAAAASGMKAWNRPGDRSCMGVPPRGRQVYGGPAPARNGIRLPGPLGRPWRGLPAGARLEFAAGPRIAGMGHGRIRHPLERGSSRLQRLWRWLAWSRAARRGDHRFLHERHARFWSTGDAANWHARTASRFERWFLVEHQEFIEAVVRVVDADPRLVHFYEIGTGNGRVLEYFAGRLPSVREFAGVDLNQAQIDRNRAACSDDRIRFECADAASFVAQLATPGSLFLTNAGVFEYFAPEVLVDLIGQVAARLAPSALAVIEPLAPDMDLETERDSRPFGFERSFSHNYPHLFEAAGFETVHRREKRVGQHRLLEVVAVRGR